jgi:RNA recognition motif-containing protein
VPQDNQGRSSGYGVVKFEKEKELLAAIDNMDGASFNGRKISVRRQSDREA